MPYRSRVTKTYNIGLSCCFRQMKATSHCRFLHGYDLHVKLCFSCPEFFRDTNGWVIDFGGLKEIKAWLQEYFDHKLLVATDDPLADHFRTLEACGACEITWLEAVGCEALSMKIYQYVDKWLQKRQNYSKSLVLDYVEVREHDANSAIFEYIAP